MAALSRTFVLRVDSNANALYQFLKQNWRAMADAGKPISVTVTEYRERRSVDQNKLLHAVLKEISEQAFIDGKHYELEVWKEMVRRKFIGTEEIDLPDGTRYERGMSTSSLDVAEFSKLVDVVTAWAVTELGVEI